MIIPLSPGNAHLRFRADLGDIVIGVRLDWLTRYGYFNVELSRGDEVIARSRALHPDIDLLEGLGLDAGRLYLDGKPATPDNLGEANKLRYEP